MSVETVQRVCGSCDHRAVTKPRRSIRQWLGLRMPAARCLEPHTHEDGYGALCQCQDPCHGS